MHLTIPPSKQVDASTEPFPELFSAHRPPMVQMALKIFSSIIGISFFEFYGCGPSEFVSMCRGKSTRFKSNSVGRFSAGFAVFSSYNEGMGVGGGGQPKKGSAIENTLVCSLEELCISSTK
ncbi:hypothetical protein MA16_Dca016914 [Dendrobium catenatum]|uniref:Uncharacterized protein n=1 Tax=Dendrobium catenatum TaxID=906689 RepID=A0A2I0W4X9_9ASPA|nr:hypothetical protein MA16_Dca016914 [Dendrobium catenatum]